MRIELRTSPGCPNATSANNLVTDCLGRLGIEAEVIHLVGPYPSPTVLIDGVDVMRPESESSKEEACRLDLPTSERVLAALRARL